MPRLTLPTVCASKGSDVIMPHLTLPIVCVFQGR